jgi:acetyltransferase-like isoleucine patch superfamily enzyme
MFFSRSKSRLKTEDPSRRIPLLRRIPLALTRLYSMWLVATYRFASKGRNLSIHYTCKLPKAIAPRVKLGNSVVICKDAWLNISGLNISAPSEENCAPVIILEDGCFIAPRSEISAKNCIHLERNVMLSPQVLIMDHSHAYEDVNLAVKDQGVTEGGEIRIGEGSWIGHSAAIVCNRGELVLGRNCVVAANSLVTRSFPDYSVIAGNPARIVRQYDPQKAAWVIGAIRPSSVGPERTPAVAEASASVRMAD